MHFLLLNSAAYIIQSVSDTGCQHVWTMLSVPDNIRDGSWQSPEKVNTWCDISSGTLQKMYQDPLPLTLAWPLQILRGHPALKTELESHYQSISDLTQSSMKLSEMTPSHNSGDYLPNPDLLQKGIFGFLLSPPQLHCSWSRSCSNY